MNKAEKFKKTGTFLHSQGCEFCKRKKSCHTVYCSISVKLSKIAQHLTYPVNTC